MKTLNDIELKVLKAVADNIIHETNGQFGYSDQVRVDGLTVNQIKGYLSQLVQKGMIRIWEEDGQTNILEKGIEAINYDINSFELC